MFKKIFLLLMLFPFFVLAEDKFFFIRDDEIENVLADISAPITKQARFYGVRFNIIVDPNLNAFVIGGKDVFINSGLLTNFKDDPTVFAGVFAHELGHLLAKHTIKFHSHMESAGNTNLIGMVLGGIAMAAGAAEVGQMLILGGMQMSYANLFKHSRQHESEADKIAANLLTNSGIGTDGLLRLFSIFRAGDLAHSTNSYFRTHPLSKERFTFLKEYGIKSHGGYSTELVHRFYRAALKLEAFTKKDLLLYSEKEVALKSDRNYANAVVNLRRGKIKEALALIDELAQMEPENPYVFELKGQIFLSGGDARNAVESLKKAYDLCQESKELITMEYVASVVALGKKDITKNELDFAMNKVRESLIKDQEDPGKLRIMANLYAIKGDKNYSNYYLAEAEYYLGNKERSKKMLLYLQKAINPNTALGIKIQDLLDSIKDDKE